MAEENAEVEFNWLGSDDEEVARNLFKCVRDMDEWGAECIIVEGVEEKGIGRSVMERLQKMSGGVHSVSLNGAAEANPTGSVSETAVTSGAAVA
jgi:hypothetical protein